MDFEIQEIRQYYESEVPSRFFRKIIFRLVTGS